MRRASEAQARPRPAPGRPGSPAAKDKPGTRVAAPPAPIEAAKPVNNPDEDKPPLVISKVKIKDPVLVFYQQAAPANAVQQLLMDEKTCRCSKLCPWKN
ncbi:MAG: hypothetical protein WKG07_42590 [Hymenobacter sp.]